MTTFARVLNTARFKVADVLVDALGVTRDFDRFMAFEQKYGFPFTKAKGRVSLGYTPDLETPRSFNEKSIHRRLYSRDPLWPVVSNKVLVRQWLADNHLDQGLNFVETPFVIEDVDAFDFNQINEPVVIKAAWASGRNLFVRSPKTENWEILRQRMKYWQELNYFPKRLVWAETQMKRTFAVETLQSNLPGGMLDDYKFYVFHGRVELLQVIKGRGANLSYQHYNRELSPLSHVSRRGKPRGQASLNNKVADMVPIAERIGKAFDFARIDLYQLNGAILFGEITQCPANGFAGFTPLQFDFELGDKWRYDHSRLFNAYLMYEWYRSAQQKKQATRANRTPIS